MARRLRDMAATALGVIATICCYHLAPLAAAQDTTYFELDTIFPRNATYKPADIFPFALAIQNMSAVRSLPGATIIWDIMRYGEGWRPTGLNSDYGYWRDLPDAALTGPDDTYIFVVQSNVSRWIRERPTKEPGDTYRIKWYVSWNDTECGEPRTTVRGEVMFSVEAPWEEADRDDFPDGGGRGVDPVVVGQVSECPDFGKVVGIHANATGPDCPLVRIEDGRQGKPCAVRMDDAVASSIVSRASSSARASVLATSSPTAATTTTAAGNAEETGNRAGVVKPPVETALAVAGLFGSIMLSY